MAVSKIWPLYQTLDKAIKYICNPEKTEDGTLIATYQCSEKFADYEFGDVAKKAHKVKNARVGYHTIISFSPEDNITSEKALEVGKEIIDKYTKGKFQYVLTVHTDRDHIHVHCIFNSVGHDDFKKFHIKDKELDRLEKITDHACRENNLSVIEKKSGQRGKYSGNLHKKLREAIDRSIQNSFSYEEFLTLMEMEEGYEIKQGKYLSFTVDNNGKKYTMRNRGERFGFDESYSIDGIKDRIYSKNQDPDRKQGMQNVKQSADNSGIKKLINISENKKAKEHKAYRRKLEMINISTYAGMINFVKKYNLIYADDFTRVKKELEEKSSSYTEEIRNVYSELTDLESDVIQYEKFFMYQQAHEKYLTTQNKDLKFQLSDAYKQYESALYYFKKNDIRISDVTVENLEKQKVKITDLHSKLEKLRAERERVKDDIKQMMIIEENNKNILGNEFVKEGEQRTAASKKER